MSELRRYRINARLSVDELSERSGIDGSVIYRIESGKTQRPSVDKLSALADVLSEALGEPVQPADIDPLLTDREAA